MPFVAVRGLVRVGAVSDMELEPVPVRVLPRENPDSLALRSEARTAAIAAAGGVLAGAATVAAVRAMGAATSARKSPRRLLRRREPAANVVASRSFLVDVHLLGR